MQIIRHRCNTIKKLKVTPLDLGIEVDIRSYENNLIIHHEPFVKGELFSEWIKHFKHKTLILNVKEEGLEESLLDQIKKNKIEDFFFLDQSFPFLIKTANRGESRCAVRISEFESIDTALSLVGKIDWVWLDCFTHIPQNELWLQKLKLAKFKICLVSPELQGRNDDDEIFNLKNFLKSKDLLIDAVCTKKPQKWL